MAPKHNQESGRASSLTKTFGAIAGCQEAQTPLTITGWSESSMPVAILCCRVRACCSKSQVRGTAWPSKVSCSRRHEQASPQARWRAQGVCAAPQRTQGDSLSQHENQGRAMRLASRAPKPGCSQAKPGVCSHPFGILVLDSSMPCLARLA